MIKALATTDAGQIVLLGLTDENIQRMRDGEPIFITLTELGLPELRIALIVGATEAAIEAALLSVGVRVKTHQRLGKPS